jgi:hypothetical protein
MRSARSTNTRWLAAVGPLCAVLACSVYDDSLLGAASTLGGADAGGAAAGSLATGGSNGASGGSSAGGSSAEAGHGGSSVGGVSGNASSGAAGSAEAGAPGGDEGGAGAVGASDAIDDMEDQDSQIEVAGGRDGFWYVGHDMTAGGMQVPDGAFTMIALAKDERPDSLYAAHMEAKGFTAWGSVIGFNLVESMSVVSAYDASAYCGVRFWAKAAISTPVHFSLPDSDTHPAGNVCEPTGAADQLCNDHFTVGLTFTPSWKQIVVKFTDLHQNGSGYHPADMKLKPSELFSFEWSLPGNPGTYEIWIDDVSFVTPTAGKCN